MGGFLLEKNMKTITTPSFRKLYAFGKKLPLDLSLSENPLGCSPNISMVLKQLTETDFFDYPDPDCLQLKSALNKRFRIKAGCIFIANGSEAIIKLIPQVLIKPGDEVIIPRLTFPMFEIASKMSLGKVTISEMLPDFSIDLDEIKSKINKNTKLIFLCNPNNPTGKTISKKQLLDFVRSTSAIVVVDEANIEFGGSTLIRESNIFRNLIVLRTFSKGFGLAGFRIGFCVASKDIIRKFERGSQPFPVSTVAEKTAIAALADKDFIKMTKKFMKNERSFISRQMRKRGFEVVDSQANNLLIKIPKSFKRFSQMLKMKGVSVVDSSSFDFEKGIFIRVSPRLRTINIKFIQIIDQIIKTR